MSTTAHSHPVPFRPSRRRAVAAGIAGLAVVASAATVSEPASARDNPPHQHTLQRALDDVVEAGAPGAVVIVRHGNRTVELSSGHGDLAPAIPIRVDDRARIGGVTKSYTAAVLLQLVDEGTLSLDDTLEDWLPGTIPNGSAIHVRQLLNHTSGIYDYAKDETVLAPYYAMDLTHHFDLEEGIRVAVEHGPQFEPGAGFGYSNTNYLLLARIIEAVTHHRFEFELRTRILEPLRLESSSYPTSSRINGRHMHGYLMLPDQPQPLDVTPWSPSLLGPAGAILSNAHDVARFYRSLLGGRLLSDDALAAMKTIDPVATGGTPDAGILGGGWGLGLLREEYPCGAAWGHDAENPGYMTAAWSSEDGQHQVVVIVNTNTSHDDPIAAAMRTLLALAYCNR